MYHQGVHKLVANYVVNYKSGVYNVMWDEIMYMHNSLLQSGSTAMKMILECLAKHPNLETIVFDEETILNKPIEAWPICHCFMSFFSFGFPLEKAIAYWHLRNPMLINDLEAQYNLLDRSVV